MQRHQNPVWITTILIITGLAVPASAKDIIRCTAKGKPDVTMVLDGQRMLKRVVSCISGNFLGDGTPCAPNGGFGLSTPTGSGALSRIVDRWQDYGDHMGGIIGYNSNATTIHFEGGFFSPLDGGKGSRWSDRWFFTANRLTGEAKLTEDGKPDTLYACAKAAPRF